MLKYMKLYYYFNKNCSCCKDYDKEVNKIVEHFKMDSFWRDTDESETRHTIRGVPSIFVEIGGKTIYSNTGNLPSDKIIEELEGLLKND